MNTFQELVLARMAARERVRHLEQEIKTDTEALLRSKHPFMTALRMLGTTFGQVQERPVVSILQGVLFLYRDYKEGRIPGRETLGEYLMELAIRIFGGTPNKAAASKGTREDLKA